LNILNVLTQYQADFPNIPGIGTVSVTGGSSSGGNPAAVPAEIEAAVSCASSSLEASFNAFTKAGGVLTPAQQTDLTELEAQFNSLTASLESGQIPSAQTLESEFAADSTLVSNLALGFAGTSTAAGIEGLLNNLSSELGSFSSAFGALSAGNLNSYESALTSVLDDLNTAGSGLNSSALLSLLGLVGTTLSGQATAFSNGLTAALNDLLKAFP